MCFLERFPDAFHRKLNHTIKTHTHTHKRTWNSFPRKIELTTVEFTLFFCLTHTHTLSQEVFVPFRFHGNFQQLQWCRYSSVDPVFLAFTGGWATVWHLKTILFICNSPSSDRLTVTHLSTLLNSSAFFFLSFMSNFSYRPWALLLFSVKCNSDPVSASSACLSSWSPPERRWSPSLRGESSVTALPVHRPCAAERNPTDGHYETGEEKKDRPNSPGKKAKQDLITGHLQMKTNTEKPRRWRVAFILEYPFR